MIFATINFIFIFKLLGKWCYTLSKTRHLFQVLSSVVVLHEVGGVPFEILEPVLTRCTPEQLFRVEECNPVNSVLLNSGNHGGDWASVCLPCTPFDRGSSMAYDVSFFFLCLIYLFLPQLLGFKAFETIITDV